MAVKNMITLHDKNDTTFEGIGLVALSPFSCKVSEEINGGFDLQMIHPRDDVGKWRYLEKERIIMAETPTGRQPFRIYRVSPDNEQITVWANHVFYDLLDNISIGKILEGNAKKWAEDFDFTFTIPMPFTFSTDIDSEKTVRHTYDRENQVKMILGNDNSFISFFGGEVVRDKFRVFFAKNMGEDTGYTISYGKNLLGIEVDEDLTDTFTRVYAYGESNNQTGRAIVDSPRIDDYIYPKIKVIEYNDTADRLEMTKRINDLYAVGADLPKINIKVDFIQLEKTEEYKQYKFLKKLKLGDILTVHNPKMNFTKKAKVISYEYDSILQEYNRIQLGELRAVLTSSITQGKNAYSVAEAARISVTEVSNNITGRVSITSDFLYLPVDSADYLTAKKIYRLGRNGIEYSSTGYNGSYSVLVVGNEVTP